MLVYLPGERNPVFRVTLPVRLGARVERTETDNHTLGTPTVGRGDRNQL